MRVAILGGGMSGISLARILKDSYGIDSVIYEKEKEFGGLCRTEIINGKYVFDISGGHIFNSKSQEVVDFVFNILPKENWTYKQRKAKIKLAQEYLDYPFEFSLSRLPKEQQVYCIDELYKSYNTKKKYKNFAEFLENNFGKGIYNLYLKPYNEKVWKYDLRDMDYDWVEGKMPLPIPKEILEKTLMADVSESKMVHSSYYYPNHGGIQTLVDKMSEGFSREHLGEEIKSIRRAGNSYEVNGEQYDIVVNTIPLPELIGIIEDMPDEIMKCIKDLKYNSVMSFIFESDKFEYEKSEWSWLYIPEDEIVPNRIMYTSNLTPGNAPEGKFTVAIEVIDRTGMNPKDMLENIKEKLGYDNLIGSYMTKYAYVIHDINRKRNMDLIKNYFEKSGIVLHGRFAEWNYPNMDICIQRSMLLAKKIKERAIFCNRV